MAQTAPLPQTPIADLNTTPLIDVLLVLLILFVITIPAATHSLELDLPQSTSAPPINPVSNKVVVTTEGEALWNGAAVSDRQLAGLVAATTRLPVEPTLLFEPVSGASYDRAAKVVQTIKAAGASTIGMTGNERYSGFDKPAD